MLADEIWLRNAARRMARRMFPDEIDLLDLDEVVRRLEDEGYTNFRDVRQGDLEEIITETIETARVGRK